MAVPPAPVGGGRSAGHGAGCGTVDEPGADIDGGGPVNWKVLLAGAIIVVPLIVVLALGFGKDPHALPVTMEHKPAPAFSLDAMDGEGHFDLAELKGRPVVLNFYASWCVPCAQEHPWLVQVSRTYIPKGVVFLGVLYNDEPAKGRGFLARYGKNYPTLLDPGGRVAIDYGVAGVPETYVIDREGMIVRKFVGPVTPDEFLAVLEAVL
ncbi:MAG: thiol:disulfide interchange protein [Deltaproteobacteria bacterium]|nr:MAG: thiol:disulfide interchange protein [Deltaproteobacteria bacterium]